MSFFVLFLSQAQTGFYCYSLQAWATPIKTRCDEFLEIHAEVLKTQNGEIYLARLRYQSNNWIIYSYKQDIIYSYFMQVYFYWVSN